MRSGGGEAHAFLRSFRPLFFVSSGFSTGSLVLLESSCAPDLVQVESFFCPFLI